MGYYGIFIGAMCHAFLSDDFAGKTHLLDSPAVPRLKSLLGQPDYQMLSRNRGKY